jgi:hypothetical protein
MTVGIKVGNVVTEIGTGSFLHSFFSTVSYHLEPKGWGSAYPVMMKKLYQGQLDAEDADEALAETKAIQQALEQFKPEQVIWDIEDLEKKPPWGDNISAHITSLANYFVTSTGRDLIGAFIENLDFLRTNGGKLTIVQYQGYPIGNVVQWSQE